MTLSRNGHGPLRAVSSRPESTAREIMKKRYKTEQKTVFAKRRKLDLHTSYANPPPGYTHVPVGTPELAERCKELSRRRQYAIHVVNSKPASKYATDPDKISHHIHRIGYHFNTQIVDEACQELGYVYLGNSFVKEADLEHQQSMSRVAGIMAKHGVRMEHPVRETPEQVRAAIRELFPRIPQDDLDQIVHHAWEADSQRVGTNEHMSLARRAQLATIARIRHMYTDYDRLLKAFAWKDARLEVEQDCLKKLIEWRGETQDDNELEEIIREIIVIDDDEEEQSRANNGSEADDEDSGDVSDTSVEITYHVARDEDLGAESATEAARSYRNPYQQQQRAVEQQKNVVRHRIGEARRQIREGHPARPAQYAPQEANYCQQPVYHALAPQTPHNTSFQPVYQASPAQPYRIMHQTHPPTYAVPTYPSPHSRPVQHVAHTRPAQQPYYDAPTQIPTYPPPSQQMYDPRTTAAPIYTRAPPVTYDPRLTQRHQIEGYVPDHGRIYERRPEAIRIDREIPMHDRAIPSIEREDHLAGPRSQAPAHVTEVYDLTSSPFRGPPHRDPPPLRMQPVVVDLTTPPPPRQPVHGAPAPVQQAPRYR
ncbi:hypothetical protein LTR37_011245 [Vermiconidia calcicola]|uniref:Uncharacterized protein n=1 Tax=Vermiconidia calcicola TaxID=1690605 RepID=A0ACC3N4E9_9PEZI|nr:hypothetical protein LTR37_011245 [Vermiconidia calcicola]